jgi:hypothetical protein
MFSNFSAYKNYTTQGQKDPCLKSRLAHGTTLKFENLREFKTEFRKNFGYESGIHRELIHEKIGGQKSCVTVPFRLLPNLVFILQTKTAIIKNILS